MTLDLATIAGGRYLVAGGESGYARLYDCSTGSLVTQLIHEGTQRVQVVAVSTSEKHGQQISANLC
jgi:WD40 repeat protein